MNVQHTYIYIKYIHVYNIIGYVLSLNIPNNTINGSICTGIWVGIGGNSTVSSSGENNTTIPHN